MSKETWYGARCIFLHSESNHGPKQMYEERIVLIRADSFDEAIARAEREAEEYCRDLDGCEYLGHVNVFHINDEKLSAGTETFSSMQKSDLKPKEYLDLHYPDSPEDCEVIGERHRWYNLDGNRSACYHCRVVRNGQLWKAKKHRVG